MSDNQIYPWHMAAWQEWQGLQERLPHAILFHGNDGIGKTKFVEHVAQSLLCEQKNSEGHACGECQSCLWVMQYGHPDYRRIRPEFLEEEIEEEAAEDKKAGKTPKASREIKIDQIRSLADFMNVSTHRNGKRVIVIYPAEALNGVAANALLKTLEEPVPNTVFLLVSHSLDRLMPTILSRCRQFALPSPEFNEALTWLQKEGVKEPEVYLHQEGGAPLAAYTAYHAGLFKELEILLNVLSRPEIESALKGAEQLQKAPIPQVVLWFSRWIYDVMLAKSSQGVRYYVTYQPKIIALADKIPMESILALCRLSVEYRQVAEHPLSPKLFLEEILLSYIANTENRI
jgi:DNA polymerase-3 subunit delta'